MKKSELTQLTQIIECIVTKEVRKQLPAIIAETFQNMMGKSIVTENQQEQYNNKSQVIKENNNSPSDFKASLKELFAGTAVLNTQQVESQPNVIKQYTKNPILNQILNETSPDLRQRERLVGSAAFQGGYSPTLSMIPDFNPNAASTQQSMVEDTSFLNNMPSIPISPAPILVEGRESTHVPLSALPEGISALDAVKYIPAAPEVKQALTRNYSQMMKLIDKKRGKV